MNHYWKEWPTHKKGRQKREEISAFISQNPNANLNAIAAHVGLSTKQVQRHLEKIRFEQLAVASIFLMCLLGNAGNWLLAKDDLKLDCAAITVESKNKAL